MIIKCEYCDKVITAGEARYSQNVFRKDLCQNCQRSERLTSKRYPKKLAQFINNSS